MAKRTSVDWAPKARYGFGKPMIDLPTLSETKIAGAKADTVWIDDEPDNSPQDQMFERFEYHLANSNGKRPDFISAISVHEDLERLRWIVTVRAYHFKVQFPIPVETIEDDGINETMNTISIYILNQRDMINMGILKIEDAFNGFTRKV